MVSRHIWIVGSSCSGKTARLVQYFAHFCQSPSASHPTTGLVFAANSDIRSLLFNRLVTATQGKYPVKVFTPLGFFQDEVMLFWPLVIEQLEIKAQFPLLLRPENEQELAARLWQPRLEQQQLSWPGTSASRLIRRILDFGQLAALGGIATGAIAELLHTGCPEVQSVIHDQIAESLQDWQHWCLTHGLLTYSSILQLYRYQLLSHPTYQQQLRQRFQGVFADDVDEYPALMRHLLAFFLEQNSPVVMTYNPAGQVRLGLGADPHDLESLAQWCQIETLDRPSSNALADETAALVMATLADPLTVAALPETIQSIQTISRAHLLRQVATVIVKAVQARQIQPHEIVIIGPGLDAIARYTLQEILGHAGVGLMALNEQRPLVSVPIVRALLTLLALVYPGLGRLIDRDSVAEMLVVLNPAIDPVRAGLITDHCFEPHPITPRLLAATAFPRWDRLGYQPTQAYAAFLEWIAAQQLQYQQRLLPNPVALLDRAIQQFLWNRDSLPYDQLSALRELLETAQHYWELDARLQARKSTEVDAQATVATFIQLLQAGTVTANPYPVRPWGQQRQAVTLATVFQYRSSRASHRWQFWLDAGSLRWLTGIDSLYKAEIFLQERLGQPWSAGEITQAQEQRLQRIVYDLLSRAQEQIFLCHSELATNGQEQVGPLLPLINAAIPLNLG